MASTGKWEIQLVEPEEVPVNAWSGGATSQLGIGEGDCSYGERNFLWRLSSATVEDETSRFTALPDYHRLILMQEGTVFLRHDEGPEIRLEPWQVHGFDGGSSTVCRGRAVDFNLMLRKGRAEGRLRTLRPAEAQVEPEACGEKNDAPVSWRVTLPGVSPEETKRIYAFYDSGADLEIRVERPRQDAESAEEVNAGKMQDGARTLRGNAPSSGVYLVRAGGVLLLSADSPESLRAVAAERCRHREDRAAILAEIRIKKCRELSE